MLGRLRGDAGTMDEVIEEALDLANTGEDQCLYAEILREQAHHLRGRGRLEAARKSLRAARDGFVAAEARPEIRQVSLELAELQGGV